MQITFTQADPTTLSADVLLMGVGADLSGLEAAAANLGGHAAAWCRTQGFTGAAGTALSVPGTGTGAATLTLIGTGKGDAAGLRKAAAKAGRVARDLGAANAVVALGAADQGLIEALLAGNYTYDRYKPESDRKAALTHLTVVGDGSGVDVAAAMVRGRWQDAARDMVNDPPAELHPESMADWAQAWLGKLPGVDVEVWDEHRLQAEGCVGIIAVGQGSERKPRLIRASYRSAGAKAHVALVGKGVTFDAGGLSIKPSSGMQTMRCDMGGAATMLAAFGAAVELGLDLNLDVWVGAAENMVDGNSYKLGDVLTYKNGVTVEIHNTDAEGRLVLADALIRACEVDGVTHLVDAATLTGACVIAIGSDFTGLFTADDDLADSLGAAAKASGEGFWRLPLHQDYKAMLKADWAQIKNVGGREAGATTAALFLQHFVDGPKWAHLDIAGSSFHDKGDGRYAAGATGEPVRSVVTWLQGLAG